MEQVNTLEELLQELSDNGKDAGSEFNLRSEEIQSKDRTARIPKIKKEAKKKSKFLIPLELAIPFNPTTGKADDKYNPSRKFRPIMSVTKLSLMLKELANRNEATKKAFMSRAGVESWDTSDTTTLTEEDKAIFIKYRVPVIYTVPVVTVNIPALTGNFARDYIIDVQRDPITGDLVNPAEEPLVLQANRFFRDVAYEEVAAYQEKLDNGILNDTEQVQKTTKMNIYSKNPVRDDHPLNWLICVNLPLITSYQLNTEAGIDYLGMNEEELRKNLGLIKLNKKMNTALDNYRNGAWKKFDKYYDYWEIDMSCPTEEGTPADIGMNTAYEKPQEEVADFVHFDKLDAAFKAYLDNRADIEKVFLASARIAAYNETVEKQIASALKTVIDTNNEFLTKEVIKRHSDFLTIVLSDDVNELLLEAMDDEGDRAAGVLDDAKSKKEYDLSKMMAEESDDDEDETDVNIEEVDVLSGTVEG